MKVSNHTNLEFSVPTSLQKKFGFEYYKKKKNEQNEKKKIPTKTKN